MNLQENIRRILRESLESEWNEGNYDYQHGFCHYFAYNIIDKIRERFPNKKVNYYLLLANEVNKDTDEVEQDYLLHVYIKIGDKLLDSNGFTTMDEVEERVDDWYGRQLTMTPEEYDINVWEEESDEIPEMFFNNRFCNTKRVKEDMEKFLSHPSVQKLLKDTINESEEKKPKLLSTIEEDGLFQIMQDTGLSLPQIYTKTGELPREVLEGYIKDFIKQEGYHQINGVVHLPSLIGLHTNVYIEFFYLEKDKVTVEISGYNDYGELTDGYIESLSNLTDEEIFTIVENMIKWITYSEM